MFNFHCKWICCEEERYFYEVVTCEQTEENSLIVWLYFIFLSFKTKQVDNATMMQVFTGSGREWDEVSVVKCEKG